MKEKYIFPLLFLLALIACQNDEQLPAGILTHDQMVDLMVDVELMQAELKYDFTVSSKKIDPEPRFLEVFRQHNITKDQFNQNLEYYGAHPLKMKEVYVDVIEELSRAQAELR